MRIVLSSASPRRAQLLEMLGLEFEVIPSDKEETAPDNLPIEEKVMAIAKCKAADEGDVIISADTIVYFQGEIFGKPKDEEDAFNMLKRLSGNTHEVYTGICVNGKCDYEKTYVTFRCLSDDEILSYISSGEPMDKAGAYGAQGKGALLIEKIDGDFFNVMGLPISKLSLMLKEFGVRII